MEQFMEDTIVAISTALGKGALSIIRVSGSEAIDIVNTVFKGKNLKKVKTHTIHYGHILDKEDPIDEVLVSVFLAPKTFTTENIVEINCHGGIFVTNRILELLLVKGCRMAEAGEFTKRAFLNGRIDLTQAESVMDIIEAKTTSSLKMANYGLRGDVRKLIENFRSQILSCIAKIEVNIDYPEYEEEDEITKEVLKPAVVNLIKNVEKILEKSQTSIILKEGISTAIIGKPNVGKSSLLNALLREEKAIVTEIAGTTRDIVEGVVNVGGIILNLVDTAGIRDTEDIVEKIGVEKTKKVLDNSSLIILVFDYNTQLNQTDIKLLDLTKNKDRIIVVNKRDLPKNIDLTHFNNDFILVSSFDDFDIEKLEHKIKDICNISDLTNIDYTYIGNARQISKLRQAKQALDDAHSSIIISQPIDIINIDLSLAWKYMGEILGEVSNDELISELFSNFCLGK